jgi:hypothetical protein
VENALRIRLFVLCALLLFSPGCGRKKSDLDEYLETIRASGMSEGAHTALHSVAALVTQKTLLTYEKDERTGRYDRTYRSAACPLPNATEKQLDEWKKGLSESAAREIKNFRTMADFDNSGFITTVEGNRFRQIYEAGIESAYLCRLEPCTLGHLSSAIGMQAASLLDLLKSYDEIQQRATSRHLRGFPRVPLSFPEAGRP